MLGIMGVHAGVYLTAGGFFLLDSFFALSGFLITSLLIVEWRKRGTIKLGAFWARRARRLLPALFVMLIGVAIIYGVFVPAGTYPTLRGDALSALFYFANWHFIASGSDYFHMTGLTSPLIHTWSLAVEEQFYLVWPLVFLGVMKLTRSLRVLLVVAVVGALASASEMALLYNPTNINRLYFGTDTHAQSVLVGATLAIGIRLWAESRRKGDESNWQARTPWARPGADRRRRHRSRRQHRPVRHGALRRCLRLPGRVPPRRARCVRRPPQRVVRPVLAGGAAALVPSLHLHRADLLRHVPLALPAVHLHQRAADRSEPLAPLRRPGDPHHRDRDALLLPRGTTHPAGHVLHPVPGPGLHASRQSAS